MKRLCAAFFMVSFSFSVSALDWNFAIEPFVKIRTGTVNEYVYELQGTNGLYKLSELQWPLQPLKIAGLAATLSIWRWQLDGSLSLGMPGTVGMMYDYDWLNRDGILTHYSQHRTELVKFYEYSLETSWNFKLGHLFELRPLVGFRNTHYSWDGREGYAQYAPAQGYWSENIPKAYVNGLLVSYSQDLIYPYLGLGVEYKPHRRIELGIDFSVVPYIYAVGIDRHWLRGELFLDDMAYGYGLLSNFALAFYTTERQKVQLSTGFTYLANYLGFSYTTSINYEGMADLRYLQRNGAFGAGAASWFDFTLSYSFLMH